MILQPGVHLDVPAHLYHADPCPEPSLSSGTMGRLLNLSALHAKVHHRRLNDDETVVEETSDMLDRGQLAHAMLLGGLENIVSVDPAEFPAASTGGIPDGWTNKAIKLERDRIKLLNKVPVLKPVYEAAYEMSNRARQALERCEIPVNLEDGDAETTIVWQEGDIWCRARPDWWHKDRGRLMLDYKSTAGVAHPDFWIRRQMKPMGFGLQSAHYRRGAYMRTGKRPDWLFLVQENYPPFACSIVGIGTADDEIFERQRDFAYTLWGHHMKSGEWPGYSSKVAYSEPSTWDLERHEKSLDELIELGGQG